VVVVVVVVMVVVVVVVVGEVELFQKPRVQIVRKKMWVSIK